MTMKGKVLWHVTMSLDGFIASPNHTMDWMSGLTVTPGIVDEMVATTGTILAGRRGYDAGYNQGPEANRKPYGGAWNGPIFVLHPPSRRRAAAPRLHVPELRHRRGRRNRPRRRRGL